MKSPSRYTDSLTLFKRFILALLLLWSRPASAELFFYAGAGTAVQFPGTIRVGYNSWEGGLLTTGAIGLDQIFPVNQNVYAAFGPVLTAGGDSVGIGIYGAFGVEYNLFWGLTFRGEMNAVAAHNGFARGELNAGLGLHF